MNQSAGIPKSIFAMFRRKWKEPPKTKVDNSVDRWSWLQSWSETRSEITLSENQQHCSWIFRAEPKFGIDNFGGWPLIGLLWCGWVYSKEYVLRHGAYLIHIRQSWWDNATLPFALSLYAGSSISCRTFTRALCMHASISRSLFPFDLMLFHSSNRPESEKNHMDQAFGIRSFRALIGATLKRGKFVPIDTLYWWLLVRDVRMSLGSTTSHVSTKNPLDFGNDGPISSCI